MKRATISIIDGRVVVSPAGETVWMAKEEIAQLFGVFVAKVSGNIASILKAGQLDEGSVCYRNHCKSSAHVEFYNLEMITALAFRIRSHNADLFRRWLMNRAVRKPPLLISQNVDSIIN